MPAKKMTKKKKAQARGAARETYPPSPGTTRKTGMGRSGRRRN